MDVQRVGWLFGLAARALLVPVFVALGGAAGYGAWSVAAGRLDPLTPGGPVVRAAEVGLGALMALLAGVILPVASGACVLRELVADSERGGTAEGDVRGAAGGPALPGAIAGGRTATQLARWPQDGTVLSYRDFRVGLLVGVVLGLMGLMCLIIGGFGYHEVGTRGDGVAPPAQVGVGLCLAWMAIGAVGVIRATYMAVGALRARRREASTPTRGPVEP